MFIGRSANELVFNAVQWLISALISS